MPFQTFGKMKQDLINRLHACCSVFDSVDIICYLRSQEEFSSSLYNQFVKNVYGISCNYQEFCLKISSVFDYDQLIGLWEKIFGTQHVFIRDFNACREDPIRDFCDTFLNWVSIENAKVLKLYINERLSRDVLEFKRKHNLIPRDHALAIVTARCFSELSKLHSDQPGYQVFGDEKFRQELFQGFKDGNIRLSKRFALGKIPTHKNEISTYPGLSNSKANQIQAQLIDVLIKPRNKVEIMLRRIFHTVINYLPGSDSLLMSARQAISQLKLWHSV